MHSRAMHLEPFRSAQPSALREALYPWRFKFLNTCRRCRRIIDFHAGVCGHDADVVLLIHLRFLLIQERYLNQNVMNIVSGLMPVDKYVGYNHHPNFVCECDVTSIDYLHVSSTSLPGGNQVDGLPPVASFGFEILYH